MISSLAWLAKYGTTLVDVRSSGLMLQRELDIDAIVPLTANRLVKFVMPSA